MTRDEAMEKIRKCLRLAASSNSNEAAVALRQAQALMKKHGIGRDDVELADVELVRRRAGRARVPPNWLAGLMSIIERAFGVRMIHCAHPWKPSAVEIVGVKPRAEIAGYAWDVLRRQLVRDRAAYMKTLGRYKRENKIRKADVFASGWVTAVGRMVTDFALDSRENDLVEKWLAKEDYQLETIKPRTRTPGQGDGDAALAGLEAGKNAHLRHGMGAGTRDALTRREPS